MTDPLPPDREGPELAGIEDTDVVVQRLGSVTAWTSVLSTPPDPETRAVRAHHRVVQSAWSRTPSCLPARFGQWFDDEALAREALEERHGAHEEALARLRGLAEMSVRFFDRGPGPPPAPAATAAGGAGRGTLYMEELARAHRDRQRREERARDLAAALEEAVGERVRDAVLEIPPPDRGALSVAHLVERDHTDDYRERVGRFAAEQDEFRLVVAGPWAPWSFGAEGGARG